MNNSVSLRTLYLNGSKRLRVLQDGPALRVRTRGTADQLFPLRNLVQVIVCGPVDWATGALLACAEAAIPVVFLRANGSLRARVLGAPEDDPLLNINRTLEILLNQTAGSDNLRQWFAAKCQQARLALLRSVPWQSSSHKNMVLKQTIMHRARLHVRATDLQRFDRQVYSLTLAQISRLLQDLRIDTDAACIKVSRISLARDFTNVLLWSLQDHKLRYVKHQHGRLRQGCCVKARLSWRHAVEFTEMEKRMIAEQFQRLLKEWHIFLMECVRNYGN